MEVNLDVPVSIPPEMWDMVLSYLRGVDLCSICLLNKYMNQLASYPGLWRKEAVKKGKVGRDGFSAVLAIDRFQQFCEIDLSGIRLSTPECTHLLTHCLNSPSVEALNLSGVDLSEVPEELIGRAIGRLKRVSLASLNHLVRDFWSTRLTTSQIQAILEYSLHFKTLTQLNLEHVDLSQVPADLLAKGLSRLEKVNLTTTNLTTTQSQCFLQEASSSPTLRDVDIKCVNLEGVKPEVIARGVSRLQKVNLGYTWLSPHHFMSIFDTSIQINTLEEITIFAINLATIPPQLLAQATGHLRKLDLTRTELTTEQVIALLERSIVVNKLEDLDLQYINLSHVPADLLAKAIARLIQVTLTNTHLTSLQSEAILRDLITSKSIKGLNMANTDMSEVTPPSLVAEGVANLCGKVNLENTNLTSEQSEALFSTNIKATEISLWKVNLSRVDSQILSRSVASLHKVNLGYTSLETHQIIPLLQQSLSSSTLIELYISGVNLSSVPSKLLAQAIQRLTSLIIWKNCVTTEQCTDIMQESLTSSTLSTMNLLEVDLSGVQPVDLIGRAVARLAKANLGKTCLSCEQCFQLLAHCNDSTSLVTLRLDGVDYSGVREDVHRKAKYRFNI